jgi:hypothetical protein
VDYAAGCRGPVTLGVAVGPDPDAGEGLLVFFMLDQFTGIGGVLHGQRGHVGAVDELSIWVPS